ncbi:MAG: glycogen/starch/alpha-glucan phosphorylase [Opitutales bacterium]
MSTALEKKNTLREKPDHFENGTSVKDLKRSINNHLLYTLARHPSTAKKYEWWVCVSLAVRDRIVEQMIHTQTVHNRDNVRRVYYLSLEYLMGRLLTNNMLNANIFNATRQAITELGLDPDEICEEEHDMGLGNGGLGRLAACFLDSMATLDLPAIGYGIHYDFGLFRQEFVNGYQVEHPDNWVRDSDPWEIERYEYAHEVHLYGHVETRFDDYGNPHPEWVNTSTILGVPYDTPICGYQSGTVNFLRLWSSKASEEFDLQVFNEGGYVEAVREKAVGETVSRVLYPNDQRESGKELRLVQQYFFVCCSLHDIVRRFRKNNDDWKLFPEKVAIQLNDTHPALAVAELMRIFVDEQNLSWNEAWSIVTKTFAYTNHTLLPEALERWSVALFERILPRHLQIIYEINHRHLEEVESRFPGDTGKKAALSLVEEGNPKMIRMAFLAVVGSHAVNGVAALHTQLLEKHLFADFYAMFPDRFQNKTNGITPRRWIRASNPRLSALITEKLGNEGWVRDLMQLKKLEPYAENRDFQEKFMAIKHENKKDLAGIIKKLCGIDVNPSSIFDVQIKRLHEYKRQHLKLLYILTLYRRLLRNPELDIQPRVFIFGGKAAPGYELAKNIIKAINSVGAKINSDERINGKLKVVFIPNYGVSLASRIIPAADLSEQISTAGKEASGTGNMKLALNGALTIGTLDGANVEIKEEVGDENIFIFGHTVEDVDELRAGGYNPYEYYSRNRELAAVIDWLSSEYFAPEDPHALHAVGHSLLEGGDPFLVLADYEAYCHKQMEVDEAYRDSSRWAKMAILNTARMGKFSSDRTIAEYARDIWNLSPVPLRGNGGEG